MINFWSAAWRASLKAGPLRLIAGLEGDTVSNGRRSGSFIQQVDIMLLQVFSRHASEMSLCLMRADGSGYLEVMLDPYTNRTGDVWHIQLSGLKVRAYHGAQSR